MRPGPRGISHPESGGKQIGSRSITGCGTVTTDRRFFADSVMLRVVKIHRARLFHVEQSDRVADRKPLDRHFLQDFLDRFLSLLVVVIAQWKVCLLYTSPSPRDS